jgi:putative toxin-antitoxin system antitoxin component (TIGR02293 family)
MPKAMKTAKKIYAVKSTKLRSGSLRTKMIHGKKRTLTFSTFVTKVTPTATKIQLIRSGVAARVVDDMVEYLDVPKSIIFGILHTPESTAHKLIRDGRALDSAASERIIRVADLARTAEETFGSREAATKWLKAQNRGLAGATPLSMLDTEPGAGEVRRLLASIDYGGVF